MFQLSLTCPKCFSTMADWHPSITQVTCDHCRSTYSLINGVFQLYSDIEIDRNGEFTEKNSGFARISDETSHLQAICTILEKLFADQIADRSHNRVFLDAGCGYGDLSIAAAELFDDVVAVDAGEQELEYLAARVEKQNISNIHIFRSSLGNLPFSPAQFMAIGCIQVLEHVSDPEKVIGKLSSVLSPGGLMYLSTPNRYSLKPEVHTGIWGIGYLPDRIALFYARMLNKMDEFSSIRLLTMRQLQDLFYPYFRKNISFIRSGIHLSIWGKLAKWAWERPFFGNIAAQVVADIELIAWKK